MRLRFWLAASLLGAAPHGLSAELPAQRQAELHNLLKHDCGSCHGLTMKGGLGPPLLPEVIRHKPDAYLTATILYGRPGTPMPPWRPFLTDQEAAWLVQQIREGVE